MARMNENLNLCEILKDCPYETKLYCTFLGDVIFLDINENTITVRGGYNTYTFFKDGKYDKDGECVLFPSKDQRDWSKIKANIKRFNPGNFEPFDKVLLRDGDEFKWVPSFIDRVLKEPSGEYSAVELVTRCRWGMCIPYNDETKHLSGTTNDCPEYYKWWEK